MSFAAMGLMAIPVVTLAAPAGEILAINGPAEYREANAPAWQPARVHQAIMPLSSVKTGDMGSLSILLADKAQVKLGQNTTFQVQNIATETAAAGDKTIVKLLAGRAWAQIKQPPRGLSFETPTVAAGIHGTDWVIDVAADGKTTLAVLSGVIELKNEFGTLDVKAGEEGVVEVGKAPVKRLLVNAQERLQWVAVHRLDRARYPEFTKNPYAAMGEMLDNGRISVVQDWLARMRKDSPSPVAWLAGAELALGNGDVAAADQLVTEGAQRYPDDRRFMTLQVQVALYRDDTPSGLRIAKALTAQHPAFLDGWLVLGEAARLAGDGDTARLAYMKATTLAPDDARGWQGLGVVELERDATRAARLALQTARDKAGDARYAGADLGTLYTYADQPTAATPEYKLALEADESDYVALTGLGIASLKAGKNEAALDYLLRANAIEPKYARSVVWLAVAYYRQGKARAARDTLDRAAILDPNDPLPYMLRAMIERDEREPAAALAAARAAAERMPKLKSLNQVASDRQGSANIGATLADMGLDAWANHYAQSAYYPYFAGSHLFLAQRYSGNYNKTSELLQGLLADPTVFGTDPRRENLTVEPGVYGQVDALALNSKQLDLRQFGAITNGYANASRPIAWFAQASNTSLRPKDSDDKVDADDVVFGVGSKLTPELGLFAYGSQFHATSTLFAQNDRQLDTRIDIGSSYRLAPQSMLWAKLGWNDQDNARREGSNPLVSHAQPKLRELALRHTLRVAPQAELSYGLSSVRRDSDETSFQLGRNRFDSQGSQVDRSETLWLASRYDITPMLRVDAGLDWQHFDKSSQSQSTLTFANGLKLPVDDSDNRYSREHVYPKLGMVFTPRRELAVRVAYQEWQRSYTNGSLQPVATADIPVADKLVLPGGEQKQWRAQLDWEVTPSVFVSAFHQQVKTRNITFAPTADVENQPSGVSQIDALLGSSLFDPSQLDGIAVAPIFREGRVRSSGVQFNAFIDAHTGAYLTLVHNDATNTSSAFGGLPLPGIRERNALAGVTWANGAWTVNAEGLYGSDYADTEKSGDTDRIESTRQLAIRAGWRSEDRRWLLQGIARHTFGVNNATIYGLKGELRF